jgi:hypothetical protein
MLTLRDRAPSEEGEHLPRAAREEDLDDPASRASLDEWRPDDDEAAAEDPCAGVDSDDNPDEEAFERAVRGEA